MKFNYDNTAVLAMLESDCFAGDADVKAEVKDTGRFTQWTVRDGFVEN